MGLIKKLHKYKHPVSDENVEEDIKKITDIITRLNGEEDERLNSTIEERLRRSQYGEPKIHLNEQFRKYLENLEEIKEKYFRESKLFIGIRNWLDDPYIAWTTNTKAHIDKIHDWKGHVNYHCDFSLFPNQPIFKETVGIGNKSYTARVRNEVVKGLENIKYEEDKSCRGRIYEDIFFVWGFGVENHGIKGSHTQRIFDKSESLKIFPENPESLTFLMKYLGEKNLKSSN